MGYEASSVQVPHTGAGAVFEAHHAFGRDASRDSHSPTTPRVITGSGGEHVWRAQIVLRADGRGAMGLIRRAGTSKTSAWRWQDRLIRCGMAPKPPKSRPIYRTVCLQP
jgi:hypothetical protein